jgi:hypothetical protein
MQRDSQERSTISDHATTTGIGHDSIVGRLIGVARYRPGSIAIIDGTSRVTYADLDAEKGNKNRHVKSRGPRRAGPECALKSR